MAPNVIHWIGSFFLLAAMALLVVASVTSPIWDNQGFLRGTVNGQNFVAGNWGWIVGSTKSGSMLGYDTAAFNTVAGYSGSPEIWIHALTVALILTPICAGLSFLALLFTFSTHLVMGILASLFSLLAFIVTIVSLGLDLGLFVVARHRINNDITNSHAKFGAAIWLVVAAAACQLIAAITVCFTRKSNKRRAEDREFAAVPAMRGTPTAGSVVGSTHPMMHDTNTYNNTNRNSTSIVEPTGGYTGSNEYTVPGTGAHHFVEVPGPSGAASTNEHQWRA